MQHARTLSRLIAVRAGSLLAVLALLVQLAASGLSLPQMAQQELGTAICSAATFDDGAPPAPHHDDCALCPLCTASVASHLLLAPPPPLPAMPADVAIALLAPGFDAIPPGHETIHAFARGPPSDV